MNLYEIDQEITKAFYTALDPDTGEIVDEYAYKAMNSLQMDFDKKVENILLWIKNLRAESAALKAEKQAFADRQKSAENKASSLEKYVSSVLNGKKFSTKNVEVSWRKSVVVEVTGDIQKLPRDFIKQKEPELNKAALKECLKYGVNIPGASLVEKNNIQIK